MKEYSILGGYKVRKCLVLGLEMKFHGWFQRSDIIEPSPMAGGHSGGVLQYPVGLVEDSEGKMTEVLPKQIKFIQ